MLDLPAGLAGLPIAVDGWGFVHKEEGQGNPRPYRYAKPILLLQAVAPLEALDPACRVHYPLLAGEERMTGRANIDFNFRFSGTGGKSIAAGTRNDSIVIPDGMNSGFHRLCTIQDN